MIRRELFLLPVVLFMAVIIAATLFIPETKKNSTTSPYKQSLVRLNSLPLVFEPNWGQAQEGVHYSHRGNNVNLFLKNQAAVLSFNKTDSVNTSEEVNHSKRFSRCRTETVYSSKSEVCLKLLNSNPNSKISGKSKLSGRTNYLFGNDPAKWIKDVPHYSKVQNENIYPGIDLEFYGNGTQLEYDFIVSPGADPDQIQFALTGVNDIGINGEGDLILALNQGSLTMKAPNIYQNLNGFKKSISGEYMINQDNSVGFKIDDYMLTHELVIDPILVYSSFLGGNNYDTGRGIKTDSEGNIYVAGHSASDVIAGVQSPTGTGDANAYVIKLDPSASSIIYMSFFGGSAPDFANCLDVDAAGHAYVAGQTKSDDFPMANAWQDHNKGGWIGDGENHYDDAFVTKLNPEGNGFIYSTYLGSELQDEYGPGNPTYGCDEATGIAADVSGNAYVVGWTNSVHFPTTGNAYQDESGAWANGHENDAFLTKFDPTGAVLYSTYLGAVNTYETNGVYEKDIWVNDEATGIAVDDLGNMYVTGFTDGDSFPTTPGAYQPRAISGWDQCFVTKLNPTGSDLVFSTLLNGNYTDISESICLDKDRNTYIAGLTSSENFPTVNPFQKIFAGGPTSYRYDAFMSKINTDGSDILYSTYWGGSGKDLARAIAVDDSGYVYITGYTESSDLVVRNGLPNPYGGGDDVFVVKIDPQKTGDESLIYSTYLGGSGNEYGNAITVDHNYNALVTGLTKSANFPVTADAIQPAIDGTEFSPGLLFGDVFISKIGKKIDLRVYPDGVAYDDLHWDTDVGPLQSSFFDLTIEGPNLGNIDQVYFKKLSGKPEDSLIVKNIRIQDTKIEFDLSVLHPASRAPRHLFIKAPNKPDINVSKAMDKDFIVTRIKTFFNQGVDASSLQTHEHRDVSIAHKKGILRIELDDPAFYNSSFTGHARITGMVADSSSRAPFTYLEGYTEQELIQGKDYLAIAFSPKLGPGELAVNYRLETDDGLVLFCPQIIRDFVQSETLNIYTISYVIKYKSDGSEINPPLQPPTEVEVKQAIDELRKLYPISGNRVRYTHAGKVILDKEIAVDDANCVLPSGGTKKIYTFNALSELFLRTMLELKLHEVNSDNENPYNIIVAFFPEGTLFEDSDGDGDAEKIYEGFTYEKSRIICLNPITSVEPLAKLGPTLAHEIGHIISSSTRNTASVKVSQYWDLGDEYEGGKFYCDINPPVANQLNIDSKASCNSSPYNSGKEGDDQAIYTSLSAYNSWLMKPALTYLGFGASEKKYNFMGNAVGDSNWISVKTYDVLMHALTPNVSKGSGLIDILNLSGEMLDISGIIYKADSANFIGFTKSETGVNSPDIGGPYSLELQDLNQTQLASLDFDVEFIKLSNPPVKTDHAFFNYRLEVPAGTKKVVLKKDGVELAAKILSDNAPTVQITSPQQDQVYGNIVNISWNANDPDNDPLTYSVYCSYASSNLIPVSVTLKDPIYKLDASLFPDATNLKIVVFANDGLNIGKDSVSVVVRDPVSIDSEKTKMTYKFELHSNYPNPFNPKTTIKYEIREQSHIELKIYNISGQLISVLVDENQAPGNYKVEFNGRRFSAGTYYYVLKSESSIQAKKMLLIK